MIGVLITVKRAVKELARMEGLKQVPIELWKGRWLLRSGGMFRDFWGHGAS
jgi:hypothetical protein